MICRRCNSENLPAARFCAACGERIDAAAPFALVPPFAAVIPAPPVPLVLACNRCGRAMRPDPYFSRGVNIAKALVLMIPFNVLGPLAFFFLRKDRLICGFCRRLLTGEIAIPMLQAFTPEGRALPAYAGALAMYEADDSVAVLEHQGRRARSRAVTWGVVSAALAALGALMAGSGDTHAAFGFLIMATPPGFGAWLAAVRSRGFTRRAVSRRGREQRARILELARAARGRLNVTDVATDLRVELADAESVLNAMVEGHRIEMEVDDAGRITYVFTELGGH